MGHRPPRSRFDTGASLRASLQAEGASKRGIAVLQSMVAQRLAPGGLSAPPVSQAIIGGSRVLAVRAAASLARRIFGSRTTQVQAIARQTAARPAVKVAAAGGAVVAAERVIEATTGRSPARMVFDLAQSARGRDVFDTGQRIIKQQLGGRRGPMAGQQLAVQHVAIRQWQTFPGGPIFTRFADGHIEVQKKNGVIKHFRPYRPVVIPRRWNARSMSRVATALKRQRKTATKILQITGGVPKRTVRVGGRAHKSVDV